MPVPGMFSPTENALPPQDVRIIAISAEPWQDGKRVRIRLELTPFQQPPNLELCILDPQSVEVARTTIIENIETRLTFTLHLRSGQLSEGYTFSAAVFYTDLGRVDTLKTDIHPIQDC